MNYRAEIDGLRALAVLPVILFHAGFKTFEGGFVGVDVFFVISGYLITTIILSDLHKGSFSLLHFYERRARRILPALFFVMFCCFPFAWVWLLPNHLEAFSKSLASVALFSSNFLFWNESGYFNIASELKPLLHTWSLAIEEQFYILYPLVLLALTRLRKKWLLAFLTTCTLTSLALAHWGSALYPSATFFLLPTRAWELSMGGLIAFCFFYKSDEMARIVSNRPRSEFFAVAGFSCILLSVFLFSNATPFPSLYALLPTVGTALLILFARPDTIIGRLLSTRIMVGIGLISYSAYLWHQPLFAFARHRALTELTAGPLLLLAAASLLLAYFSWRFVEAPFRNNRGLSRKQVFSFALSCSLLFLGFGLYGSASAGWPSRIPKKVQSAVSEAAQWVEKPENRTLNAGNGFVYLIGDSHGRQLSESLDQALYNKEFGFLSNFFNGCPPLRGIYRPGVEYGKQCYAFNEDIYRFAIPNKSIKYVVLSANWSSYIFGENLAIGNPDMASPLHNPAVNNLGIVRSIIINSINSFIASGKTVVLVYPVPFFEVNVTEQLVKSALFSKLDLSNLAPDVISNDHSFFKTSRNNIAVYDVFNSFKDSPNVIHILPENIFCNTFAPGKCVSQSSGSVFYLDKGHLSNAGARLVSEEIAKQIAIHSTSKRSR